MDDLSKPILDAAHAAVQGLLSDPEKISEQVKASATDALESAGDILGSALKKGAKLVQEHPVESLLIGFGAGFLLGTFLNRKQ